MIDFYDSLIEEARELLSSLSGKRLTLDKGSTWQDVGHNQMIMQRDTACELEGVAFNLITGRDIADELILIGEDIGKIKGKRPFARIALIQMQGDEDEQKSYNLIRKIEYTKYHTYPDGYMIRSTSRSHKEAVRVSLRAVKKGISFAKIGQLYIDKYKENPAVRAVKLIFITAPEADYEAFEVLARRNNSITEALNHVMSSVNFDCDSCKLKSVCDEVEGMRELHFRNKTTM